MRAPNTRIELRAQIGIVAHVVATIGASNDVDSAVEPPSTSGAIVKHEEPTSERSLARVVSLEHLNGPGILNALGTVRRLLAPRVRGLLPGHRG